MATKKPVRRKRKKQEAPAPSMLRVRLGQAGLVLVAMLGIYLLLTLFTYERVDPSFPGSAHFVHNAGGLLGAWSADVLFSLLGLAAYGVPLSVFYYVRIHWQELRDEAQKAAWLSVLRFVGWCLILLSLSGLATLTFLQGAWPYPDGPGGVIGLFAPRVLLPMLNLPGTVLCLLALLFVGLTLFSGKMWLRHAFEMLKGFWVAIVFLGQRLVRLFMQTPSALPEEDLPPFEPNLPPKEMPLVVPAPKLKPVATPKPPVSRPVRPSSGERPTIELLDEPQENSSKINKDHLQQTAQLVEQKLSDFGIMATVMGVFQGPVVTRYEIQLAPGVKVAKLTTIAKDLARSLSVPSVRVVEVISGKAFVGLELPNVKREMVRLKEVLDCDAFQRHASPLCMGLGKDISGRPEVVDLAKMPHLLVAGTTGSGKSVGLNAMLLSLLLKSTPQELRLIMIDPKMLELSMYEGIPHLLTPVVVDMKEAANALRWSVKEMDRRYRLMAALGVRNIAGFNEKVAAAIAKNEPLKDPIWLRLNPGRMAECPTLTPLPYIVVLVDEFADMMMVVGKKVEELITRLAQKARAAGIHLILATQRPSVDVITGLIKANVPTRIAFQVSSKIDSRTILDQQGAEQLLGNGDMLYLPAGSGVPVRVHGAYVSDDEVQHIVDAWKACGDPDYIDSIVATDKLEDEEDEEGEGSAPSGESDPLYDEAVQIVLETRRASISLVQRRLRIGYNRSARLLEDMEKAGLVSEIQANGLREVLVEGR